jgi:adenosylmethionine-8-amino-7-oxononanoate aminotransferase
MDNGLICYPMGGTVDGRQGSHVLFAPPYNVSKNQLSDIVDRLAVSLDTTLKTLD